MDIGEIIRAARGAANVKQDELANRLGMRPAQLCIIERGKVSPSVRTVERIAEALGLTVAELFRFDEGGGGAAGSEMGRAMRAVDVPVGRESVWAESDWVPTREFPAEVRGRLFKTLKRKERVYEAFAADPGLVEGVMIPLVHGAVGDERGAEVVARAVRDALGAGSATFADLAGLLEFRNVHLHGARLPQEVPSAMFFDRRRRGLTLLLDSAATPERQTYRIAYELGWAVLFASKGFLPLPDRPVPHRFARSFSAAFLMPEEAVRQVVAATGIRPNEWTMGSLCALKTMFNVSAEAFALRLESLGLIQPVVRESLRDELRRHYVDHPRAMEPSPSLRPLAIGARLRAFTERKLAR